MTAATWPAAPQIARCHRCGKAGRISLSVRLEGRLVFCSRQCEAWHNEQLRAERAGRKAAQKFAKLLERWEELRRTPLHELYPGMLGVLASVQAQRPSYCRWLGCEER